MNASEAEVLRDLASALPPGPVEDLSNFCEAATLIASELPQGLRESLFQFSAEGSPWGVLIIRGFKMGQGLPPTPLNNELCIGSETELARVQSILNQALGEMVTFEAEAEGCLFQDMVPDPHSASTQTSLSSRVELELHTEQSFSELRPDWVSLSCLRGADDAYTYILTAQELMDALDPLEEEMLREPLWTIRIDTSFRVSGYRFSAGELRGPFPIVAGSDDDPFVRFDQELSWGISPEAETLRQRVIDVYLERRNSYSLKTGDLLLLDNHRALHGRSAFKARFDETDRFVIRSFTVRDLAKSRYARPGNGRMIAASFS